MYGLGMQLLCLFIEPGMSHHEEGKYGMTNTTRSGQTTTPNIAVLSSNCLKKALSQKNPVAPDDIKADTSKCRVYLDSAGRATCQSDEPCQQAVPFLSTRFCIHPSVKKIVEENGRCI